MDQKAREAGLDHIQWKALADKSIGYKRQCDGIERVVFQHTIEPNILYVKLIYEDGKTKVMELKTTDACVEEYPKCRVLAETAFHRP